MLLDVGTGVVQMQDRDLTSLVCSSKIHLAVSSSCMVYVTKERYNTELAQSKLNAILKALLWLSAGMLNSRLSFQKAH